MVDLKKILILLGLGSVLGLFVGSARGIIQYKHDGWANLLRGILASILVAILITWLLDSIVWPDTMKAAIVGVCSYVADDILVAIGSMALTMRSDPTGFIQRWLPSIFKNGGPRQ